MEISVEKRTKTKKSIDLFENRTLESSIRCRVSGPERTLSWIIETAASWQAFLRHESVISRWTAVVVTLQCHRVQQTAWSSKRFTAKTVWNALFRLSHLKFWAPSKLKNKLQTSFTQAFQRSQWLNDQKIFSKLSASAFLPKLAPFDSFHLEDDYLTRNWLASDSYRNRQQAAEWRSLPNLCHYLREQKFRVVLIRECFSKEAFSPKKFVRQ